MSPHRSGSSTVSPSSVIIEFHEFDGRWFVTDRWGAGSGTCVERPVRNAVLGKKVLERVAAARSEWRSFVTPADYAELWDRFCVNEAGVPSEEYQPEKRLVILAGQAGMRCHDPRRSPPVWEPLPDKSPRALGAALIQRIGELEPAELRLQRPAGSWPYVASLAATRSISSGGSRRGVPAAIARR